MLLVFLAFGFLMRSEIPVFAQTSQVETRLQQANAALGQAFTSVSSAESAGANVTSLVDRLNVAANLLAQAENAYRTGNNITAIADSAAVLPITQQVTSAAQAAKQTALSSNQNEFWKAIVIAISAIACFVLILFLIWRTFKKSYISRLMKSTPEATNE